MKKTVLLTAAEEDSGEILKLLEDKGIELLHYPLEIYKEVEDKSEIGETLNDVSEFDNIVYGSKRNAAYFLEQVEAFDKKRDVRQCLNLTLENETADFLEENEIPAVCSFAGGKSINLVEFMLRLHRMGPTLYPCGSHKKEEIPGFLEELDIPVKELALFELEGPVEERLATYRKQLKKVTPDAIIFHSRRAVNRTLAAFPVLPYKQVKIISADKGITKKLDEKGIAVDEEAEGSWQSIAELL